MCGRRVDASAAASMEGDVLSYATLDYLPDLTFSQMANARQLVFTPYSAPGTDWVAHAEAYGSEPYALLHSLYAFHAVEGVEYDIYSVSFFDPYVAIIYDAFGNAITANSETDDGPGFTLTDATYQADIIRNWTAPYTGTFYVDASWNQGNYYTFYSLSLYESGTPMPNRAPAFALAEIDTATVSGKGVRITAVASDADGDALNYVASLAANGTITGGAAGSFVYTPKAGFVGEDSFNVTVSDGRGGTAVQTVHLVVAPQSAAFADLRLIMLDGQVTSVAGSGTVFGTNAGGQDVTVLDGTFNLVFDASFGRGGDIVRISGDADEYTIGITGSNAVLTNGETVVTVPIGTAGLALVFDDGARTLLLDGANVKLGAQILSSTMAGIVAAPDGKPLPVFAETAASGRLILFPDADATVKGKIDIFGTNAAGDHVTFLGGKAVLDGSFAKGGDTLSLVGAAGDFSAYVQGSNVVLTSAKGSVTVPIGTAGVMLDFGADDRLLRFDVGSGTVRIGDQSIATGAGSAVQLEAAHVASALAKPAALWLDDVSSFA